jgi:hypothetical protein
MHNRVRNLDPEHYENDLDDWRIIISDAVKYLAVKHKGYQVTFLKYNLQLDSNNITARDKLKLYAKIVKIFMKYINTFLSD